MNTDIEKALAAVLEPDVAAYVRDQLIDAQMRGYRSGLEKGLELVEQFMKIDLSVMWSALDEVWKQQK